MEAVETRKNISDVIEADGTRIIVKPDGTVITIRDGKTTVQLSPEKEAERLAKQKPAPKRSPRPKRVPPDFGHLPVEQQPLNVGSWSTELIGQEMSNFEHAPFDLDGRRFASVEAFYVWLKFHGDPEKQELARKMYGIEAKMFGMESENSQTEYDAMKIDLGSPEHHALIKRAIQAKLQQHPDLARRFAATYPGEIIHDSGAPERSSRLPAADFTRLLTEIRQDLVDGKIATIGGTVEELAEKARVKKEDTPSYSVSEFLKKLLQEKACGSHNVSLYLSALREFPKRVTRLVAVGETNLVFEMPDDMVLVFGKRKLPSDLRSRQNVLHVIESDFVSNINGARFYWYTQPKADTNVTAQDMQDLRDDLLRKGYAMLEERLDKIGIYNGAVKVLDPMNLRKLPSQ